MQRRTILLTLVGIASLAVVGAAADWFLSRWNVAESPPLPASWRVDRIVVIKGDRRLELWDNGQVVKSYRVALGSSPSGHKQREGDGRTPEGLYKIDGRNPNSRFHLSLRISYPDGRDSAAARKRGVSPGGDIFIHGLPNGLGRFFIAHPEDDWTDGCIAVTDAEIEEVWATVPDSTPIEIRP